MQGSSSDDEHDGEGRTAVPTAQRVSNRRKPHVDLSRLETQSLRKYRRVFKLGDAQASAGKEELMPAVLRHWQNQVVDEDETLLQFAFALRKQAQANISSGGYAAGGLGATAKGMKPKPKGKVK